MVCPRSDSNITMNGENPYIRQVEVLIGPLPEWRGGGNIAQAVRIFADGSQDKLRVKFSVRQAAPTCGSPTVIHIYNLSAALRNVLQPPGPQIVLNAGWENIGMVNIFAGSLLAATHQREGADIVTTLTSLAGWEGLARGVVSQTVASGIKLATVVRGLASKITGIKIDPKMIQIADISIGPQGLSFAGPVKECLDKLARAYGFNWWIDRGNFRALSDMQSLSGSMVEISADNGFLLRAEPLYSTVMQIVSGVTVTSLFNPLLMIKGMVRLKSNINPFLNGDHTIFSLSHSGDTHSSQWTTTAESWIGFDYGHA